MTAVKSQSKFFVNYIVKLRENKKYIILSFIMHMLAGPLLLLMAIIKFVDYSSRYNETGMRSSNTFSILGLYLAIGIITTLIALIIIITMTTNIYNHYNKKSVVDMTLSLPITSKDRFLSNYCAGLTAVIAPFLASCVFSLIECAILKTLIKNSKVMSSEKMIFENGMTIMQTALMIIVFALIALLMFYTTAVFCVTLTGNTVTAVSSIVCINILWPLFVVLFSEAFINSNYGLGHVSTIMMLLIFTSPVGILEYALCFFSKDTQVQMFSYITTPDNNLLPRFWIWFIITLLFIAGVFIATYFISKKRKAEDVSKPYPFNVFYYVIMAVATFVIAAIFSINDTSSTGLILPAAIVIAVIWIVESVIVNKGFKNFAKTVVSYLITTASVFALLIVTKETGTFGVVYKVPDINDVKSVGVIYDYNNNYDNKKLKYTDFDDEKTINEIIDVHTKLVDDYKDTKKYEKYGNRKLYIKYTYKNGSTMYREYSVDSDNQRDLSVLINNRTLIENRIKEYESYCLKQLKNDNTIWINEDFTDENKVKYYALESKMEIIEFFEAYKQDVENAGDISDYKSIKVNFEYDLEYSDTFKNTKAFLEKHIKSRN